jgi:hypothetical protein
VDAHEQARERLEQEAERDERTEVFSFKVGGVDITPVFFLFLFSFFMNETQRS